MRVVLDTNTLISGIVFPGGPPRRLLDGMRTQAFESFSSTTLIAELLDVLQRDKFIRRLSAAGLTPESIVADVRRLVALVAPEDVPEVIAADPDDDHVLACASAAGATLIVSGDKHLLDLRNHRDVRIVAPTEAERILLQV